MTRRRPRPDRRGALDGRPDPSPSEDQEQAPGVRLAEPLPPPPPRPPPPPKAPPRTEAWARLVEVEGDPEPPDDLIAVARLGKAWGVYGALTVRLHNPDSDMAWADFAQWIGGDGLRPRRVAVERWEEKGSKVLVVFEGVRSPQLARGLTGLELLARTSELPEPDEDEFYVHELVGMEVVDERRGSLGRISNVFSTGANDVWVVGTGRNEELIPAVGGIVLEVDRDARRIRVDYELD